MPRLSVGMLFALLSAGAWAQNGPGDITDPAALTDQANAYFRGYGVAQSDAHASELYQQAAAMGYARAMHNLGFMYAEGRGVPQDEFHAVDLYRAAMTQSYIPAITSLGIAYAEGRGVSIEPKTAYTLLKRSAEAGDKRAADYLVQAKLRP